MTLNLTLNREEFAAKKRGAMTAIEAALRPVVKEATDLTTDTGGWSELLAAIEEQYRLAYADEHGDVPDALPKGFLSDIHESLKKTTSPRTETTVDRIVTWLATAILAESAIQAAETDTEEIWLEWVTMHDKDVRATHREVDGQERPPGVQFDVDRFKMWRPGDTSVPTELWINCRCTLRPVLQSEALMASSESESKNTSTVVVGLPKKDHAIHKVGSEQKHVTLAFMGKHDGDPQPIHDAVKRIASEGEPFDAHVSGHGTLGPDKAKVAFVESPHLQSARNRLMDDPAVNQAVNKADTHPHFVPHMTLGYEDSTPDTTEFDSIPIDRLAVWHGEEQTEYPLGGSMDPETETPAEDKPEETQSADLSPVPWHGVLAPEGINSGDGRRFSAGSLRVRPLPLPLTWQKVSDDGHKGNITVAKIEQVARVGGEMRAVGHFLSIPEADEVMGLIADFGKFGVSIDADDATFELSEDDDVVEFTSARIASACIVPIPAFAEAWAALGEAPEDFMAEGGEVEQTGEAPTEEALVASGLFARQPVNIFKDLAPGKTEDGPGWLTHPIDTDRLRDYWVRGEGAAKIGWGSAGDFNRCRMELAEYVLPQYLNGYCANRHYDALGIWPGRPVAGETEQFAGEKMELEDTTMESVHLVAGGFKRAPAEWFQNPNLTEPTPLTVTDDGRVFGHIAAWTSCHIGFQDVCVAPPHSSSDYSYFCGGQVALDNGERVNTGILSIGGGHAGPKLSARAAMAHYDSTSAAVADVTCGEDEHGIWFSGWVRPGASEEMVTALMASKLSGDWRTVAGEMELVAALAVNVPGFGINRPRVAASSQGQISLVASGVVAKPEKDKPTGIDYDLLAEKVAAQIGSREERKRKMAALAARVNGDQ